MDKEVKSLGLVKKAILIDFSDSFTYNIACELEKLDISVQIKHYKKIVLQDFKDKSIVFWGPGPGHVDEYKEIHFLVKKSLNMPDKKVFGICLGHQLIWRVQGFKLIQLAQPLHGVQRKIKWHDGTRNLETIAQVYHSWVVNVPRRQKLEIAGRVWQCYFYEDQLMISRCGHIWTFQFHPESVGTNFPEHIFKLSL